MSAFDFPKSLPGFQKMFPDDRACGTYLEKIRWPDAFDCPHCHANAEPYRFDNRPGVLRCRNCKRDISLTAGTVMERTHSPLSTWFWGAYLVSTMTTGISAVQFQRQLGLTRYETAYQILHKLRAGMVRVDQDRIGGQNRHVEVDETYVGGRTHGEGKGVHHQTVCIAAVEVRTRPPKGDAKAPRRGGRYAGRLRMSVVPNRTAKALGGFVEASVLPSTMVVTDDWAAYDKLGERGFAHLQVPERGDGNVAEEYLPIVHLIFSNLKTWLGGTRHGVGPQHLQAYLNEFVFRFNRRFYPFNAFRSLLGIGAGAESPTYDELYSGEWHHPNLANGS